MLHKAIEPALNLCREIGVPSDNRARVLILAIAGQESTWKYRRQINGPARSYWQFEGLSGGAGEVFDRSPALIRHICTRLDIEPTFGVVFEAMIWNDILAASMARLLLWPYPGSLPEVDEVEAAWQYYLKVWRPGAPHRHTWDDRYGTARNAVMNVT